MNGLHDARGVEQDMKDFGFPYPPYQLQRDLMAKVFYTVEKGGIGIFESPTGTGKTLALLCPALSWMRARERELLVEVAAAPLEGTGNDEEDLEDWALLHRNTIAREVADNTWRRRRQHRDVRRMRSKKAVAVTSSGSVHKDKIRRMAPAGPPVPEGEAAFELEGPPQLPMPEEPTQPDDGLVTDAFERKLQVIYCSRTHSQLAQILGEIRRITQSAVPEDLSVVTLGARSNLCVHEGVRARAQGNAARLNELCQTATEKPDQPGSCKLKKQSHNLADVCLTEMLDIDSMVEYGRRPVGGGCPYYGSRQAACEADVLLVPYPSLVNSETRQKLGIRTEGNILIFDEAHNLLEAISDANSVTLRVEQARVSVDDLDAYAAKYEARLSPANSLYLRQLRQLCARLHSHLAALQQAKAHTVGAFLVELGVDHFNLPELSHFLAITELPRKVRGYAERIRVGGGHKDNFSNSIYGIAELLGALKHSSADDRILCQPPGAESESASIKYLSLDAEVRFHDVISSARAVIFAGGTLEPRTEFAPLYAGVVSKSPSGSNNTPALSHFAGRHIVPSNHIFASYVTHGPHGHALDFRKDKRNTSAQLSELKAMLVSLATCTPGGCVFFFPSFEYLESVVPSVGSRLGGREVFVETRNCGRLRGNASWSEELFLRGDTLLRAYANAVQRDGGAVLLAVSGAKLSEGINFKDNLCRLVAVVGLPYPNASDLGLLEKMRFLDARRRNGLPGLSGRDFYSARCMKAVNQCIGRSIRHAQDWASVLLLDHRYEQSNVCSAISSWIRERASQAKFSDVDRDLREFFASRTATHA